MVNIRVHIVWIKHRHIQPAWTIFINTIFMLVLDWFIVLKLPQNWILLYMKIMKVTKLRLNIFEKLRTTKSIPVDIFGCAIEIHQVFSWDFTNLLFNFLTKWLVSVLTVDKVVYQSALHYRANPVVLVFGQREGTTKISKTTLYPVCDQRRV